MIYRLITIILMWSVSLPLWGQADTVQVDTSSAGYKVGYQIGSWLPFILLAAILIFLTVRAVRKGKENPG